MTTLPEKLYRYRPCNGDHFEEELEALVEGKVWLSPLANQNDPFEGRPQIVGSSREEFDDFLDEVRKRHGPQAGFNGKLKGVFPLGMSASDAKAKWRTKSYQFELATRAISSLGQEIPQRTKVACFCENDTSPLMWAHYANSHQGVCLEFELTKNNGDDDLSWGKVEYVGPNMNMKTRPELSFLSILKHYFATQDPFMNSNTNIRMVTDAFVLSKSEDWAYEKEWRIFQTWKPAGYFSVPHYSVSAVIFGLRIPSDVEGKLKMALGNKVPFKRTKSKGDAYEFYIEDEA